MRRLLLPTTLLASLVAAACAKPAEEAAAPAAGATMVSIDTADTNTYMLPLARSETRPLREALAALERGDVAGFVANMTDSIVYVTPSGSELKGKQAVSDYWTESFTTRVASMKFGPVAGLGFQLIRTSAGAALGKYLMAWTTVDASYKSGKSLSFPAHVVVHLDAAGKFDRLQNYYDTKGIAEASAK